MIFGSKRKWFLILAFWLFSSQMALGQGGRCIAFLIGVDNYSHSFQILSCAASDAQNVATALRNHLGYAVNLRVAGGGTGTIEVAETKAALEKAVQATKPEDTFLFYFSGHGSLRDKEQYLLFSDADPEHIPDTALSLTTLQKILDRCAAKKQILVIDACRTSSLKNKSRGDQTGFNQGVLDNEFKERLDRIVRSGTGNTALERAVLYACDAGQSALEDDKNGLFSFCFVKALEQVTSHSGSLTLGSLLAEINTRLSGLLAKKNKMQTPRLMPENAREMLLGSFIEQAEAWPPAHSSLQPPTNPKEGDVWINAMDGMEMIWMNGGVFPLGAATKEVFKKEMKLDGFWIARTPVTVSQYRRYCEENSAQRGSDKLSDKNRLPLWGWQETHPMVNVTWDEADSYCRWISSTSASLPTEAQWERATRGTEGYRYPWGNSSNGSETWATERGETIGTTSVGFYSKRPCGMTSLTDLVGHIQQWCRDWYDEKFIRNLPNLAFNPENIEKKSEVYKVVRGSGWDQTEDKNTLATTRFRVDPKNHAVNIGFRYIYRSQSSK